VSKKQKKKAAQATPKPGCVACCYKLLTPDITLDKSFTSARPNVRPEDCPRSSSSTISEVPDVYNGVVVCVGDGDLSYGASLATALQNYGPTKEEEAAAAAVVVDEESDDDEKVEVKSFHGHKSKNTNKRNRDAASSDKSSSSTVPAGSMTSVYSTSLETRATLDRVYGAETIGASVSALGGESGVGYEVDVTRLGESLAKALPGVDKVDTFVWNFPCTAESNGQDGQNSEMEQNKELLRKFAGNAAALGATTVVITHKTKPPYNQWSIVDLLEEVELADGLGKWSCRGRVAFDKCLYSGYTNQKALDNKSFTCHDAETYVFEIRREGDGDDKEEDGDWGEKRGLLMLTEDSLKSVRSNFYAL
jgi:hypothetical protein